MAESSNADWLAAKPIRVDVLMALRGTAFRDGGIEAKTVVAVIALAKNVTPDWIDAHVVWSTLAWMRRRGMTVKKVKRTGKVIRLKEFSQVERTITLWRLTNVGAGFLPTVPQGRIIQDGEPVRPDHG